MIPTSKGVRDFLFSVEQNEEMIMCKVLDNSATGVITKDVELEVFNRRYGKALGRKLCTKITNKIRNASDRGIGFAITWEVLDTLISKLVLCEGTCDYTGESFSESCESDKYPSLDRIDSNLPYQEGNLCVVTIVANRVKGRVEDSFSPALKLEGNNAKVFKKVFATITNPDKMIEIRNQYIPNKQEKEMTTTNSTTTEVEVSTQASVPEDIQISKVYYTLMNFFVNQNKKVVITFAQFRRLYKFKNCFLSGASLTEDNKSPIILGDEVSKDTLRFAIRDYAVPFQTLIDQKGMTPTLLKNMLEKNMK